MFNEVIIVEGKNDYNKLISIFSSADIICTNGSAIDTLDTIIEIAKKREIILFLDPDYPGEKIRKTINEAVFHAKHAFLDRKDAHSKNNKKIGIEHASKEALIKALKNVLSPKKNTNVITKREFIELGFIGNKQLRHKVGTRLHLGNTNAKTFFKRINQFGITIKELKEAMK